MLLKVVRGSHMSKEPSIEPGRERAPSTLRQPIKLLESMRKNPAGDWTLNDVETLCNKTGLAFKPPRRGSHFKVCAAGDSMILTIPAKKPIKAPYIKLLVAMVDRVQRSRGE